jgi:hypothetical protein
MGVSGTHWHPVSRTRWFLNQTGLHTVKVQASSNPAGSTASQCQIPNEDYSRIMLEVVAYPR